MPTLFPLDAAACAAIADKSAPILGVISNLAEAGEHIEMVAGLQAALYARTGAGAPWIGYLAYIPTTGEAVGACSFKSAVAKGEVEIAYFTFPHAERRGYGKAMAAALVDIARASGGVETVIAHTLPEENASGSILRGAHFTMTGPVEDPEDGTVWRWERRLSATL